MAVGESDIAHKPRWKHVGNRGGRTKCRIVGEERGRAVQGGRRQGEGRR